LKKKLAKRNQGSGESPNREEAKLPEEFQIWSLEQMTIATQ
jgi:hypothetical protein